MKLFLEYLVARFKRWVRGRQRLQQLKEPNFYSSEVDPTHAIKAGRLVIVGPEEKPKWLRFTCPCGCDEEIVLNLMQAHYPRWTILLHSDQTVTLDPSVDATKCGSHFWLRRSRVFWVDDSDARSGMKI